MKAVICTGYGAPEVLKLREVEKPKPKANEVCIKIQASAVTQSDIFVRGSQLPISWKIPMRIMLGIRKPRKGIIGLVFSGEIDSVGSQVTKFSKGDQVYGCTGFKLGTYAQYKCLGVKDGIHGCIAKKPKNISHEEATAAAYGGLLALQYTDKGNIKKGDKVCIYGASGTTGTNAIQYAKFLGAHVTAVCSGRNFDLVKSLGADEVIDYTIQDSFESGTKFDFVLDAVGTAKKSKLKTASKEALKPDGIYASIDNGNMLLESERLDQITELVESGYLKPFLDKIYPLEEIVDAHRYVEEGHKRGGVAISIPHES